MINLTNKVDVKDDCQRNTNELNVKNVTNYKIIKLNNNVDVKYDYQQNTKV
jgi:hypothetical protein